MTERTSDGGGPHLAEDALHDHADDALPPGERAAADEHLAGCGACRARLGAVRALLRGAAELPRSVEPAEELWPGVRAAIERRQVVSLGAAPHGRRAAWWRAPAARLAAAAVLLVALSSGVTAVLMQRGREESASPAARPWPAADPGREAAVEFVRREGDYQRLARELEAAVAARRDSLSPEAVATLERSVRVIDAAIAEARAALEREPGNRALVEMLSASYRQKLDLLKRASQMAAGA
ncbi:MAG TPA: zf-HC2 domain-containing protein [Gemmatimonadaceae bacterium]|nr:zf-HC2 domain-containing protein [Gemmatimonadaceae bacterium]